MSDMPDAGTPMNPSEHPANNVPTATEHHFGTQHGLVDYFMAGAKDFINDDVGDALKGNLHGPSMRHRQQLIDEDRYRSENHLDNN